ncbi:MAG: ATP-binding protein [Myxococcales bacterium]|nr:ATP-binding protein [Myxococcales bacterium]
MLGFAAISLKEGTPDRILDGSGTAAESSACARACALANDPGWRALAARGRWTNNPIEMMESIPERSSMEPSLGSWFTSERLGWLIRLRWVALWGILIADILAIAGAFRGVSVGVLTVTLVAGAIYNKLLSDATRRGTAQVGERAAMAQALADFLILTVVLWAAGGVENPFIGYYAFHVALAGILGGPRATMQAAVLAVSCVGWLAVVHQMPMLQLGQWQPAGPFAALAEAVAMVSTFFAMAYLVSHAASELRDRERALQEARDRAELEYELLSATLNELDAGLEVLDSDRDVVWRNRLARELVPQADDAWGCPGGNGGCDREPTETCPLSLSLDQGRSGRCRFAVTRGGIERLYELHSFPLSSAEGKPRVMNLYLDRTAATLAERQLVMAERLASLGRVVQGVAHELNTPLATIRTLSTDMVEALAGFAALTDGQRETLLTDLHESAGLIREETGRLGRITHALLAGGDLVRARIRGQVALPALVERAVALVFVARRDRELVRVDPSVSRADVRADPDRLVQVLVNLLSNAHDAVREQGSGSVSISARARGVERVQIRVEDNGAGIDEGVHTRLFEPFATTKPPGKGTGLGLYTSYMLVRAMRGQLELDRRAEGGTCATIELPGHMIEAVSVAEATT